jgi:hypothetical protein
MTDQMTPLVQYGQHQKKIPFGTPCAGCGSTEQTPRFPDHCHLHGWVRGIVCRPCNARMITIDQMGTPSAVDEALLAALLAQRHRCPECPPISSADLAPSLGAARQRTRKDAERTAIIKATRKWLALGWGPEPSPRLAEALARVGLRVTDTEEQQ